MADQSPIDQSWTTGPTDPPAVDPVAASPARIPRRQETPPLSAARPRLPAGVLWTIGLAIVITIGAILFLLSELGTLSLGIEQYWGLSNRASQALTAAASALTAADRYHVEAEAELGLDHPPTLPRLSRHGETFLVDSRRVERDRRLARVLGDSVTETGTVEAGTESAATSISTRFNQDSTREATLIQSEWRFVAPEGQRAQAGPLFASPTPLRVDAIRAADQLYLKLPNRGEAPTWNQSTIGELDVLNVQPLDWAGLYTALAQAGEDGKRLPGKTFDGRPAKGYQVVIPAVDLGQLLLPALPALSGSVTVKTWIGTDDHRPYLLTMEGTVGSAKFQAQALFSRYDGAVSVLVPGGNEVVAGALSRWLETNTILLADSPESRDATRKADLGRIAAALATYASETKPFAYPKTDGIVRLDTDTATRDALKPYLEPLPSEPLAPERYYGYSSDGSSYRLTAVLENSTDPEGTKEGDLVLYVLSSGS